MLLIALSIFACGGTTTTYSGHTTNSYMALDGVRSWTYTNDGLPYGLEIEKLPETEMSGDTEIVTLEYSVEDPAQLLGSIDWSSDSSPVSSFQGVIKFASTRRPSCPRALMVNWSPGSRRRHGQKRNGQAISSRSLLRL